MALNRRVQLLLDEERHARLVERSRGSGASVNALIRRAIDAVYPPTPTERERRRAIDRLLADDPVPVDDWEAMKDELVSAYPERLRRLRATRG